MDEVVLSADVVGGRPPYSYVWTGPDRQVVDDTATVTVGETGRYTVTVAGANGCAGSAVLTVVEDVVPPVVELSVDGELTCDMTEVTLSATVSAGRPPYRCVWYDCCDTELGSGRQLVVSEPGIYVFRATGDNGCSAVASLEVEADREPPSVAAYASGVLTCSVPEVSVSADASGGRPPYAYAWLGPNGELVGEAETITAVAPGTYAVTVTGANGCSASEGVEVAEDIAPPAVSVTSSGPLTCTTLEVTLTAVISGGHPPYEFLWTDCCGIQLGAAKHLVVDQPGPYTVQVTGVNGCSATGSVVVGEDRQPPAVTATVSGELTCTSPQVTLEAVASGGQSPYTYCWNDPHGDPIASQQTVEVGEPGEFIVRAIGSNGCSATASVTVLEDKASPQVDLGPDRLLTCAEPEIELSAVPSSGSGPYAYLWQRDGATIGSDAQLTVAQPGTYTVTVVGTNGCSSSDSVIVDDGVEPPTVDLGPDRALACCGSETQLVPVVAGGTEPYSYAWYNECEVVIGTGPTLSVTEPGTYLLIVRTSDGCIASDSVALTEP